MAGGGGGEGWKQEGQVDHYRDPGDNIALMSDAMFSVSPQTIPPGAIWNTRTRAWCKDSAGLTRYTSGVGWLGWVTYKSRSSRILRFEGMAMSSDSKVWSTKIPLGEAVSFSMQESIQRWQPEATLLWLRLLAPQSRAKIFLTLSQGAVFTLFGMSLRAQGLQNLSVETRLYLVLDGRTEYLVGALFPSNFLKLNKNLKSMIKGHGLKAMERAAFNYFLSLLQFSQNLSLLLRLVFQC